MNIRLGTDIVYIPRIQAALDRFGERFLKRVYTPAEQQDAGALIQVPVPVGLREKRTDVSASRLAGRWAAKEAVAKALGTGWRGLRYTDIEVQRQPSGQPKVCLYGAAAIAVSTWGDYHWQVSLSHDGDYAIATAIAFCRD
ncbi:holo-ACP synthase [Trichocoleus sp. FACHB-591]|uniref:holo-ACP synthase n=1 Tax=Trichocoleus sp. FACHB-591 TaxID=2692872 RepID=UPI0016839D9A|nr:holo-ACP synthase [Trichocoleus sp. FACHB-591]MBD2094345.1 holo-ACP synthase [Trichocoleus sp. FACHB-591]